MPLIYNYKDKPLLDYLLSKDGSLMLASSGRLSKEIADSVSIIKGSRHIALDMKSEVYLGNLLNLKPKLFKIINLRINE